MARLARAANAIRAGKLVEPADSEYVASHLDELYMREREANRDYRAAIADELARRAGLTRDMAAALVVQNQAEVQAIVRAIGRIRSKKSKKGRARR